MLHLNSIFVGKYVPIISIYEGKIRQIIQKLKGKPDFRLANTDYIYDLRLKW